MMHINDTVISVLSNTGSAYREYDVAKNDKTRSCRVVLPFDSEYKFLIKNMNDVAIKLKLSIDGTDIFGDGFIVNAFQNVNLERFLNSDKKFKFVRKAHEAVSDPTSKDNGSIVFEVEKARKLFSQPVKVYDPWHNVYGGVYPNGSYWNTPYRQPSTIFDQTTLIGGQIQHQNVNWAGDDLNNITFGASICSDGKTKSLNSEYSAQNNCIPCSYSVPTPRSLESGATVEGTKSNQQFVETNFYGEGVISSIFKFNLQGLASSTETEEYSKYIELKKKFEG